MQNLQFLSNMLLLMVSFVFSNLISILHISYFIYLYWDHNYCCIIGFILCCQDSRSGISIAIQIHLMGLVALFQGY